MKASEILLKHWIGFAKESITQEEFEEIIENREDVTADVPRSIIAAMKEYARLKCERQRLICMKQINEQDIREGLENVLNEIRNAPEPPLD